MKNLNEIAIHCHSQAEKIAALHILSSLTGLPISSTVLKYCVENRWWSEFPYVYLQGNSIGANCDPNCKPNLIDFKDIGKLFKPDEIEVHIGCGHTAYVTKEGVNIGCKTFTFEAVEKLAAAIKEIQNT